jgi:hypothetical protein
MKGLSKDLCPEGTVRRRKRPRRTCQQLIFSFEKPSKGFRRREMVVICLGIECRRISKSSRHGWFSATRAQRGYGGFAKRVLTDIKCVSRRGAVGRS